MPGTSITGEPGESESTREEMDRRVRCFMDGIDWEHYVGIDVRGTTLYPDQEACVEGKDCLRQGAGCGVVEVEVRLVRWVVPRRPFSSPISFRRSRHRWDDVNKKYEPEEEVDPLADVSYSDVGHIEFEAFDLGDGTFDVEVSDYSGCAQWIQEGEGFDYWVEQSVALPGPGRYRVDGIVGHYFRGDGYTTDDDVKWEWATLRRTDYD